MCDVKICKQICGLSILMHGVHSQMPRHMINRYIHLNLKKIWRLYFAIISRSKAGWMFSLMLILCSKVKPYIRGILESAVIGTSVGKFSKTCVKRPIKNRQNKDINNNW